VWLKKGQSWVSLTSATEGVSYVTSLAPGAENWEQRRQTATIHWVDAQWVLPGPAITRAAQPHVLTTTITRASDGTPAADWTVQYEVAGGAPAAFAPQGQTAVEVRTDASGRASVELRPQGVQPGVTQVRIRIIASSASGDAASRVVVGQGWTSVTWSAPGLVVRTGAAETVAVDATAAFRIEVSNPGDLTSRNVVVNAVLPAWLRFLSSNPAAERFEPRVQWRLGDLAPRETRVLELNCRAVREGDVRLCVRAEGEGGVTAEGCANLRIIMPSLEARFVDPPTSARVGDRVTFNVEVINSGAVRLTNVIARDRFDPGLDHAYGETSPIVRSLGDLEPGAVRLF
jgi:uncharacterized repeat protein (TIGR01451 family)